LAPLLSFASSIPNLILQLIGPKSLDELGGAYGLQLIAYHLTAKRIAHQQLPPRDFKLTVVTFAIMEPALSLRSSLV
jgi:hypothetical protein